MIDDSPDSNQDRAAVGDADPDQQRWRAQVLNPFLAKAPERRQQFETPSGLPLATAYPTLPPQPWPGESPYTRGIYPSMYRGRFWTMRQYAGFSSPKETNRRFRYLLEQGQTGLSVAFDLPTQIGYDPDDPQALGEVGRVGVSIATIDDLDALFADIPLDQVSISMTINSTAPILLGLLCALAERRGVPLKQLRGTVQNDILKEFVARGTQRYPVRPSVRLSVDVMEFASEHLPKFHPISVSGYHIREAGSTAVEEVAFTLANGIAIMESCRDRNLDLNTIGQRLSFFFNAHNHLFEEVAKFRAARRLWTHYCRERFSMTDPKACQLRFHSQTGGSTLTAHEPLNNVVRVTIQALAAILGGTQSLHTNGWDEALSLPTEDAAKLALRTQQVLARESGVAEVADPLGGCPLIEDLTSRIEQGARELIAEIDQQGGTVAAIENGFVRRRIEESAYQAQQQIDSGEARPVGVSVDAEIPDAPFRVDPTIEAERSTQLREFRRQRPRDPKPSLESLRGTARQQQNVVPAIIAALHQGATLGEIAAALAQELGEFRDA